MEVVRYLWNLCDGNVLFQTEPMGYELGTALIRFLPTKPRTFATASPLRHVEPSYALMGC